MTQRKSFGSDNHAGAHPAVLRAIMDANSGDAVAYGADERTERVIASLRETFRADDAFLVLNGSGANVLGLSVLLRRHEAVIWPGAVTITSPSQAWWPLPSPRSSAPAIRSPSCGRSPTSVTPAT
jgi:threonine aldolase